MTFFLLLKKILNIESSSNNRKLNMLPLSECRNISIFNDSDEEY